MMLDKMNSVASVSSVAGTTAKCVRTERTPSMSIVVMDPLSMAEDGIPLTLERKTMSHRQSILSRRQSSLESPDSDGKLLFGGVIKKEKSVSNARL